VDRSVVVDELGLLTRLIEFDPVIIGTPPLDIDVPESDIDVACCADDLNNFTTATDQHYGHYPGYRSALVTAQGKPAVCVQFRSHSWELELFCQAIPVTEQWGFRHFKIEQRLLTLATGLKSRVSELKRQGQKTEPAFALALELQGDPYEEVLRLEEKTDQQLRQLIRRAAQQM